MKFTLRHIEIFLAVAKAQSVSKAAKQLNLSQSATSASLQEFETRYGMRLFDRSAKRVQLNALGESMRIKAEQLMSHAQSFEQELLLHEEHQKLRVGASLTIGNYLAFEQLAVFMQRHPLTKVDITVGSTPEIVEKVLNFEVDLGLIEAELHHEALDLQPWLPDNMIAFCSNKHPFSDKQTLNEASILEAEWILREPGSAHRQTFDRAVLGLLPKLNIRAELTHNEAIKNAVKSGLGLGCLSEIAIQDEVELGSLVPLKLLNRPMHRHFYIARHKDAVESAAAKRWVELCLEKNNNFS